MLYQDLTNLFKTFDQPYQRQDASEKILKYFWPNHDIIWINSVGTYKNISNILSTKTKDIIILQTEEDCFKSLDISEIRKIISSSPNWTPNSFLITNSQADYSISKDFLKSVYKPGILDLICYQPYAGINVLNIDNIKYHSSFLYNRKDKSRDITVEFLKNYKSKIATCVYNFEIVNSNIFHNFLIRNGEHFDSPFTTISKDQSWSEVSAFHIVIETFNDYVIDRRLLKFTPTLSEKTYKAMHLMRPALIYGGKGTKQKLNDLGFDTWDWLINWEYDNQDDPRTSFLMYLKELKRLLSIDIEDIKDLINANKHSLINNQNRIKELINLYDTDY
jgi:hypothetical protein